MPSMLEEIDRREREIENLCMRLLLQQQPVAKDLRKISSAFKMVTDLERIGDQSADIAEVLEQKNVGALDDSLRFREMADQVIVMVREAIDA